MDGKVRKSDSMTLPWFTRYLHFGGLIPSMRQAPGNREYKFNHLVVQSGLVFNLNIYTELQIEFRTCLEMKDLRGHVPGWLVPTSQVLDLQPTPSALEH